MQTFEREAVRGPERQVVEPHEPVDAEPRAAVIPRDVADQPAQEPAARVLDSEGAGAVHRGAEHERVLPIRSCTGSNSGCASP